MTSFVFVTIELIGGYMANSIAIMSDAVHIVSDVVGFGISIFALTISVRDPNK